MVAPEVKTKRGRVNLEWEAFADYFSRHEGFKPTPGDSRVEDLYNYYFVGAHDKESGRHDAADAWKCVEYSPARMAHKLCSDRTGEFQWCDLTVNGDLDYENPEDLVGRSFFIKEFMPHIAIGIGVTPMEKMCCPGCGTFYPGCVCRE